MHCTETSSRNIHKWRLATVIPGSLRAELAEAVSKTRPDPYCATRTDMSLRQLVLARIIEPVSKLDSPRVLERSGMAPASYATLNRRLPANAKESWRRTLAARVRGARRPGPGQPGDL
jgi:hypothetical protein